MLTLKMRPFTNFTFSLVFLSLIYSIECFLVKIENSHASYHLLPNQEFSVKAQMSQHRRQTMPCWYGSKKSPAEKLKEDYPEWKVKKYSGNIEELYELLNLPEDCTIMDLERRRLFLEYTWVHQDIGIIKIRKAYRLLKAHMQYERIRKGLEYYDCEEIWTGY